MLSKEDLIALKSIADDLAAFAAKQEIEAEQRAKAAKKFEELMSGDWTKKRAYYD